jgi:transposase-like protein
MERRKFTREFKLEAVRLIKERGVSYAQASQDVGVHTSQLRDWVKKFADDPQHAFPGIHATVDRLLVAHRAVGRRIHLDEAGRTGSERSSSGEQKANVLDHSTLEDIAAAFPEDPRFDDPVDQCQMVGVDGEFHG